MKRIESTSNALVKQWKKLIQKKKERETTGEFLVEGVHLVEEAIKAGAVIHLIVSEEVDYPESWKEAGVFVEVTNEVARELQETETSQHVFAHCRKEAVDQPIEAGKRYLLIDAVQDPGNVGTMIRTADAAGIDAVIVGKGSADPYNAKTLRSAQGSHFHLPIVSMELEEAIEQFQCASIPVLATGWSKTAKSYRDVALDETFALIVGNEGAGVAPYYMERADEVVYIPMPGRAESLNVGIATGILLFHYAV